MNIKRIIREEMGDFDWIKETKPTFGFFIDQFFRVGGSRAFMEALKDYFGIGETVLLTGDLYLAGGTENYVIKLNQEPFKFIGVYQGKIRVKPIKLSKEHSDMWDSWIGEPYIELGDVKEDREIIIERPDNPILEQDDFDWVRDTPINFEDVNLRVGDRFRVPTLNPDGSTFSIVTIIDIGLRGNEPITYRRESGMGQLQQRNLVDSKVDFIKRIIKDKWQPFYYNRGFKLNESDDLDWVRGVEPKFNVDDTGDYYGWWKYSGKNLITKLGLYDFEAEISSSDYDGYVRVESNYGYFYHHTSGINETKSCPENIYIESVVWGKRKRIRLDISDCKRDPWHIFNEHIKENAEGPSSSTQTFSYAPQPWTSGGNVNESDDLDWIRNTNPVTADDFINKAFYFDPIAEEGDEDYSRLVDKLKSLGFRSIYGTPDFVGEGEYIAGLFSYLDFDRNPKYVFTHDDPDTRTWDDYEQHIQGYALDESEARDDLEVVDARAFITQFI